MTVALPSTWKPAASNSRLKACLLEEGDSKSAELEQAWQAFTSCYSEARIILPRNVVAATAEAFGQLKHAYERVKVNPPPNEREELQHSIDDGKGKVLTAIRSLREASREALGSDLPLRPPKGL